jgi:hypothetical protein
MAINENPHTANFLLSEGNGEISRENVKFKKGSKYLPGTVVKLVAGVAQTAVAADTADLAVCYATYDLTAATADTAGVVIARDAEVCIEGLVFDAGINDATKKAATVAALAKSNIIGR